MVKCGCNWINDFIRALLVILAEETIQHVLGAIRNKITERVFGTLLENIQERGHACDPKQCSERIKALKKKYEVTECQRPPSIHYGCL